MEVQVLSIHGPTRQHLSTTAVKSRKSSNSAHWCRAAWSSNNNRGRREVDTTVQQPQIHPYQHHQRCSSNSLQTIPRRNGPRGLQATVQQVCNTCWNKKHRLPHKTTQANFRHQQLWGVLLNMGIWACTLRAWQQCTTTRPSEDSSSHEWDKRTTPTTLTPQCQRNTNICWSEDNNHGVLQNHNCVLKTSTTVVFSSQQQLRRRPSSNGYWSNIQRQRKRKEQRKRIQQRRSQRKRIPTRKRLRRLRQLQQRKGQRKTTAMVSAKRSRERKQRKVERSSQQRKRKESNSNMLQMWSTGPLGKGLSNSGVQHGRDTTGTEPGWNIPMVWPKQWVRQLLVQQRPVRQLQHLASTTTKLALPAPQTTTQTPTIQLVGALSHQAASAHNEATTTAQAVQQQRGDNEVDIMIDSGAATHVCPTWFAPDTPLYPLQHGQGPRLRTATDEDIPVHGYKWVYMHNTNKQTIVVPFYVCDVTQPIMSVTRLAEQGFNTQLNETPTITHTKGFNSALKQREGLYFLPVVLITLPANLRLEVNQTAEGTTARIAPVTLTPTGMEVLRNKNDLWTFNSQGFLVRVHRTTRKALFMPDSRCPVPTERLENYRRTIIQRPNNNTEVIEEAYQDLDKKQQKRIIQGNNWTGETWFKVKRGTILPGNIPPQPTFPSAKEPATPSQQTIVDQPQAPMYRHNVKKPLTEVRPTGQAMTTTQPYQTAIPHPKEVSPTQDYWIKEGPYWKRVHVQPRRDMYIPQQTDDGPDVTRLTTMETNNCEANKWQQRI